jgi:hypothetical protein
VSKLVVDTNVLLPRSSFLFGRHSRPTTEPTCSNRSLSDSIKKDHAKTVYILGAGASSFAGFPLSGDL